MEYSLDIYGEIVDNTACKSCQEDFCPQDLKDFVNGKQFSEDDTLTLHINSIGGSVAAGLSIANVIGGLGCKTVAKVEGLAASIASVIACSCNELHMSKSSFLMVHKVWCVVQGNSDELRKEAAIMDKMTDALINIYASKFDMSEDDIMRMLAAETWISSSDIDTYHLNAIVDEDGVSMKYAAKYVDKIRKFNNKIMIEKVLNMETEQEEKKETVEQETVEEKEQPVEETTEETTEEVKEEVKEEKEETDEEKIRKLIEENEALKNQIDELQAKLAECKPDETVEERIAKCQSTFQNKINGFKNEIKAKDEELQKFKDSVSSLSTELENTKKELHDMSAAFEAKKNALASLNAGVLRPSEELPTFNDGLDKCKTLKERVEFINSGKYTR